MPIIKCAKCGYTTNTACSHHHFPRRKDGKANKCYARWKKGKWIKGCSFDEGDEFDKSFARSLFEKGANGD